MMFRRIVFYDPANGEVVHNCLMQGALLPRTVEQEAAYFGLTNYGAFSGQNPTRRLRRRLRRWMRRGSRAACM